MRMFASSLGRDVGDGAFKNLQERLLHAFTRNVAGNRRVLVFATNLIDFVDVDDALLRALNVSVSCLQEFKNDVLDVFTNVARFGKRSGVNDGKWDTQQTRQ